jgi:hypothetical protein
MPPYKNLRPMKSHGIAVEDARLNETETYERQVAEEAALERSAAQARGDRSVLTRIRAWLMPAKVDPHKPHAFVSLDSTTALGRGMATAGRREGAMAAAVLFAESDAHEGRCRLPGCGRPVDDPIHQ